jgi:hypothetical protein
MSEGWLAQVQNRSKHGPPMILTQQESVPTALSKSRSAKCPAANGPSAPGRAEIT